MAQDRLYASPRFGTSVMTIESAVGGPHCPSDQGSTKGAPRHQRHGEVVTVSVNLANSITKEDKLDSRILSILSQPSYSAYLGWSWTNLRHRIGGKVQAVEFREAIERLLAAGEIVECWMQSNGPEPTHRLMLARSCKFIDPASLVTIRGRRDHVTRFERSIEGSED
jgi:hypothetical protein